LTVDYQMHTPRTTTTTTTTTATPPRQRGEARCSVVPALALIALLVHGLPITIIYYHNQKCNAQMWQPMSLKQRRQTLTPTQPTISHLINYHVFHIQSVNFYIVPNHMSTPFDNSITRTDHGHATSPS
jgi:hypothetical protein